MTDSSAEGIQEKAIEMLEEHHTVTISTRDEKSVWSATVFYVSDSNLNLFFLSAEKSKHIQHINMIPEVSATIYKDQKDWEKIKGIQMSGIVEELKGQHREDAINQYLAKYEYLYRVINEPLNQDEEKIGSQFASIPFFKLQPTFIRIIDNQVAFGHREQIEKRQGRWELF